ncbi:DUF4974 domain-containing protein [Sinomicrobium kalidii]|uniref:FecR family protein n=1 Tax=Sinomicrobium kalidii TaxID=2900738 RepID=UPI001E40F531|nr:FecR domain-containing protein [Sinomicrobium kalidii]UGU17215.1 DUF4974 domain-containing protein [Sinomicrobium kalidii]
MDDLILRYIEEKASPSEIRIVEDWITASAENQKYYNDFKAKHLANTFDATSSSIDIEKELSDFKESVEKKNKRNIISSPGHLLKYAAAIILLLGISGWVFLTTRSTSPDEIPADVITLQKEDGAIEIIPENRREVIRGQDGSVVGKQNRNTLIYNSGKTGQKDRITYNTLTVPYGKRFDIILSDGSKILLNSGTSIRYPVRFPEAGNREVTVRGEAFFEVAKDSSHPFVVKANGLNVRVLGTKFNVSAYEEDPAVQTVLVEGAVGLYEGKDYIHSEKTLLAPGHKATWDKKGQNIDVKETDVSVYTSWIREQMVFKHMKLKHILKKLERQYNVEIVRPADSIGDMLFTASFDNKQPLTQVLETFKEHYGIDYRITDDKIIIH